MIIGPIVAFTVWHWAGWVLFGFGIINILLHHFPEKFTKHRNLMLVGFTVAMVAWLLTVEWVPLRISNSLLVNFLFIASIIAVVLGGWLAPDFNPGLDSLKKILVFCRLFINRSKICRQKQPFDQAQGPHGHHMGSQGSR